MQFRFPGTCKVVSGDARHDIIRSANIRSSRAANTAFVASSRVAHATVGVLSHPYGDMHMSKVGEFFQNEPMKQEAGHFQV